MTQDIKLVQCSPYQNSNSSSRERGQQTKHIYALCARSLGSTPGITRTSEHRSGSSPEHC